MPKIKASPRFKKAFKKLSPELKEKTRRALALLGENPRHPSLRTKPVQGIRGVYEARVDIACRMTYERLANDILLMRVVGEHDKTLKNP